MLGNCLGGSSTELQLFEQFQSYSARQQWGDRVSNLAVPRMDRATVMAALDDAAALVSREHKAIRKGLKPRELSDRERARVTVMVRRVGFGIERPCPDLRMQASVGVEMPA
jgi:hypothetical protein